MAYRRLLAAAAQEQQATLETATTATTVTTATAAAPAVPVAVPDPLEDPFAAAISWREHLAREERSLEHQLKKQLFRKLLQLPRKNMIFDPFTQYEPVIDAAQAFRALGDFYREHHTEAAAEKLAQAYNWGLGCLDIGTEWDLMILELYIYCRKY